MGASHLYFCIPGSGTPAELLAEDHCFWEYMPSLWKLLIANGTPLGDVAPLSGEYAQPTQTIAAPAHEAIARLELLIELIRVHPLRHQLPILPVVLDGVLIFLNERLAAFPTQQPDSIMVAAQLGSNYFNEDIAEVNQQLADDWVRLEGIFEDGLFHDLEDALGFARGRHGITHWEGWTDRFGFSSLVHPYFKRLKIPTFSDEYDNAPATRSFQSYVAKHLPDEAQAYAPARRESKLKSLFLILFGLCAYLYRRARGMSHDSALARYDDGGDPDESGLNEADYRDLSEKWRYTGMFPEFVDGKVGLCVLEEDDGVYSHGARMVQPEWDEIDFPKGDIVWGRRDDKWTLIGLDDRSSTVVTDICCDEVLDYDHDGCRCIVRAGSQFGLVNTYERQWSARPSYDEIKADEYSGGFWRVRKGALWGMLSDDGELRHPCEFDSIEPDIREFPYTQLGWRMARAGRVGWIDCDGDWQVDCEWDEVRPSLGKQLFAVERESRWGVVTSGNHVWVPPVYLSAEPVAMGPAAGPPQKDPSFYEDTIWPRDAVPEFIATLDPNRALLLVLVATESGFGVVDQANRIVVPCVYREVAPACSSEIQDPRWMCIVDQQGRHGLWDVAQGREIIRCAHDWLEAIVASSLQPMAGTLDDGRYRIWNLDGTLAFDGAFRWVNRDDDFEAKKINRDESKYRTGRIVREWLEGTDVRAAMIVDGEPDRIALLKPGLPLREEYATLSQAYEEGDLGAAYTLAALYHYGDGIPRDYALARLWAGRACAHAGGKARRPTERTEEEWIKTQISACLLFSDMLYDGEGGPRDAVLARHWAEAAVAQPGKKNKRALIELAKTLLDQQAGPVDHVRAKLLLEGTRGELKDYDACYYRAIVYRDGLGVPQDWTKTRDLLEQADDGSFEPATRALAELLKKMAIVAPKAQARVLLQEAEYYETKAIDFERV